MLKKLLQKYLEQNEQCKDDINQATRIGDQVSLVLITGHDAKDSRGCSRAEKNCSACENDSNFVVQGDEDAWNAEPDDGQDAVAEDTGDARKRDVVLRVVDRRAHQLHQEVHEQDCND